MASAKKRQGQEAFGDDHQYLKLKEGQITARSRTREPTFVGSINTGHAFYHNMQGPIPPVPDLSSYPAAEEALDVYACVCSYRQCLASKCRGL
jgi:hypothetical protein